MPRPVCVRVDDMPAGHYIAPHHHAWHQLIYAIEGTMTISTHAGIWVVPPQRAVWVPPGIDHAVSTATATRARHLYIDQNASNTLPDQCLVIDVSPLLRELIRAASDIPVEYDINGADGRLIQVLLDQLRPPPQDNLHLPAPKDPRLLRICTHLQTHPADNRTLENWSRNSGASSRTLARLFLRECGMPFREWRQKLRLLYALEKLAHNRPVTEVALDLGYENTSAFIAMFRKATGTTPGTYYK
ncbi:AraC family transcriptional regulator [Thalassospira mesophila]|uniref:AraC family transcriptional regulator n=1 Tax=Thalassospira mesophila TaxID=1293891 RepID=A0A1Y2L5D8_9PROT|nr:AraC family transcriptional regulator [Thalassospira mesophila]